MNHTPNPNDSDIRLVPDRPQDAVDELIEAYQAHDAIERVARQEKQKIALQIASLSPMGDGFRTTRLRGEKLRCKIEYPPDSWDQSLLRECWFSYPQYAEQFLAIASFRVKLIEFKKLLRESGPAAFECFKQMLQKANKGPTGTPRIVIEEGGRP
jgi:hypothetical protein